ncbi:hypothetical protein C8Q77DRAFT_1153313 [Trametes polyzona]|nr:hypothetical protein C8Q77DRAFT_1153313 [Trametes polyzona]
MAPTGKKIRVVKNAITARNLAAISHLRGHPGTTAQEFAMAYNNMSPGESLLVDVRHHFAQAHVASTPGATAEDTVAAFERADDEALKVVIARCC